MFTRKEFGDVWFSPNVPVELASALAAYESATRLQPTAFTSYAEFQAAIDATHQLGAAFVKVVSEHGKNAAAQPGIALIKASLREPTATKQAAEQEYASRVGKAETELQYVEGAIRKSVTAIADHHNRMLVHYQSAAAAKKLIETGKGAGLETGFVQMAAGAKEVEQGVPALMASLRNDPRVAEVRRRGAEGVCNDLAVGGKDFDRLADFRTNMSLFREAEEKAKVAVSLATLTKQYVKACAVLLATDTSKGQKTTAIMARLAKKVEQAIATGRGDISKNHVCSSTLATVTEAQRKTLEDLASIIAEKSNNIPHRVAAVKILIRELSDLAPGSAKAELKEIHEKVASFEKDVDSWLKVHKKVSGTVSELLKKLDKDKKSGKS